jgi:hypothetical protein
MTCRYSLFRLRSSPDNRHKIQRRRLPLAGTVSWRRARCFAPYHSWERGTNENTNGLAVHSQENVHEVGNGGLFPGQKRVVRRSFRGNILQDCRPVLKSFYVRQRHVSRDIRPLK